jgi:hypothetical protein
MRSMWTCRNRVAGGVKSTNGVTGGVRLWSAGRDGKPLPRFGNPSTRPATQNSVRPISPFLWCLGTTDHGWIVTLGAVEGLECTAEVCRQRYRSRWTPWYRGLVASRAARRCSTAEVVGARRRCPVMRPVRRRIVAQ